MSKTGATALAMTSLASAQELCGDDPEGGEYRIEASDADARDVSSTLEWYVEPGDRDEFEIEDRIPQAEFTGAVLCKIDGFDDPDTETESDVFTTEEQPTRAYGFGFTEPLDDTESDDFEGDGDTIDTFAVDGVVDSFDTEETETEPPTNDDCVGCEPRR